MKVLLLEDIAKTGKKGQIVEVSEGFGRFLLKQKQAGFATSDLIKKMEIQAQKEKEVSEKELQKMQEMAGKIDGEEVELKGSQKDGSFYSAVGVDQIAKAIKDQLAVSIKPEQIKLKRPIKEAGDHEVVVVFKHGLEAELTVIVS